MNTRRAPQAVNVARLRNRVITLVAGPHGYRFGVLGEWLSLHPVTMEIVGSTPTYPAIWRFGLMVDLHPYKMNEEVRFL